MRILVCLLIDLNWSLVYLSTKATTPAAISFDDRRVIKHTRDVIADSLIQQITTGDSTHQESFREAIRHQIAVISQCLRVDLVMIDRLLFVYNETLPSDSTSSSK